MPLKAGIIAIFETRITGMFYDISLINWAIFLFVNGLMLVSSHYLASRLTSRLSFSATIVAGIMIYVTQIMLSVLLLGVAFHTISAMALGLFNSIVSLALASYFWATRKPFVAGMQRGFHALFAEKDAWSYLFLGLLILQLIISLSKVFVMPVHVWDSFSYHAPPAVLWYQMGFIPLELDVPVSRMNGKALGITVLMYWYFIFLKDSVLVNIPQFIMSIAMLFLVFAASRQCGISRALSFKVTVLCYFLPVVLLHSVTTQDHLSINIAFIAALFFFREFFEKEERGALIIAGIAIGLMMQFKINAVIYFPILGLAFVFLIWKKYPQVAAVLSWGKCIKPAALLGVVAIIVGGFWYAKNVYIYGDVFGPLFREDERGVYELYESIDTQKSDLTSQEIIQNSSKRSSTEAAVGFLRSSSLVSSLKTFFPRILDTENVLYGADLTNVSGFGPQFYTFGLPALVFFFISVFIKKLRCRSFYYAVTGVGMLLVYFTITSHQFAYRNYSFFPILIFIYAGLLAQKYAFFEKGLNKQIGNILIFICIVWGFWSILPPTFANPSMFKEFSLLERQYQSPLRYNQMFKAKPKTLRELDEFPRNEPIAYVNSKQENAWIYPYYGSKWKRRVEYIPMLDSYFNCDEYGKCIVFDSFKKILKQKNISLFSLCINDNCLEINDPSFFEINPGLYYAKEVIHGKA